MAVFTLEHDPECHVATYIDFRLNVNRYKLEQGGSIDVDLSSSQTLNKSKSNAPAKKKVVVEVDKRRLYINNLTSLD